MLELLKLFEEADYFSLSKGAHRDAHDPAGYTVLMSASASGSPDMVKEVLKLRPDVNAATEKQADSDGNEDEKAAGRTALMEAVSHSDYDVAPEGVNRNEVVRLLLKAGADPNLRDQDGNTALILCEGDADMALLLIKAGADVNAENNDGATALSKTFDDDMQRVLRAHGATGKARGEK